MMSVLSQQLEALCKSRKAKVSSKTIISRSVLPLRRLLLFIALCFFCTQRYWREPPLPLPRPPSRSLRW